MGPDIPGGARQATPEELATMSAQSDRLRERYETVLAQVLAEQGRAASQYRRGVLANGRAHEAFGAVTLDAELLCDTRSHVVSSPSIGGSTRCRRRDSGLCPGSVPALACAASNGRVRSPGESPRAPRSDRGATGEGKTERVSVSEPVVMPRYGNSPGRVVVVGMMRSRPLRIGRRRPRTLLRSCGHRCSRGIAGTRPGRISCVWNVETPSRSATA